MPSTKQRPKKKLACPLQNQDMIDDFQRKVDCKRMLLDQRLQRALGVLDNLQQSLLASYSEADLQKTVGQLREEFRLREEAKKQNSAKDEGYVTEATTGSSSSSASSISSATMLRPPSAVKRLNNRLSRSLTRSKNNMTSTTCSSGVSSMGPPSTAYRGGRPRRSSSTSALHKPMYRTPAPNRMATNFPPITPKVAPNTPMTVLRRPRKGEMMLSLSGSPLLPGTGGYEIASCNIPLEDGTLLSLVPHKIRKSEFQVPMDYMTPETFQQLEQLRQNLDIICQVAKNKKNVLT